MPEKPSKRPEDLLYRMGHNTRAMNAFFSMEEWERDQIMDRIENAASQAQAENRIDETLDALSRLGSDYDRPIK